MFNQADQNTPDKPTTLSLRDDPEPALQKVREQASREKYSGPAAGTFPRSCSASRYTSEVAIATRQSGASSTRIR